MSIDTDWTATQELLYLWCEHCKTTDIVTLSKGEPCMYPVCPCGKSRFVQVDENGRRVVKD